MSPVPANVRTYPDGTDLTYAAAEHISGLAAAAIAQRARFSLALSGGSTPRALYALLATEPFASRLAWPQIHVFWGDERCVAPDHADSNYRMARESLLDHVPLSPDNIHRMPGEAEPAQGALQYERTLRAYFGSTAAYPQFDLVLLGLGSDGHTASLFPGTAALSEQDRWVFPNFVPQLGAWRLTLTLPVLNNAANVVFLVEGANKAAALAAVLTGAAAPRRYPAQLIQPTAGEELWLVDQAAAAGL